MFPKKNIFLKTTAYVFTLVIVLFFVKPFGAEALVTQNTFCPAPNGTTSLRVTVDSTLENGVTVSIPTTGTWHIEMNSLANQSETGYYRRQRGWTNQVSDSASLQKLIASSNMIALQLPVNTGRIHGGNARFIKPDDNGGNILWGVAGDGEVRPLNGTSVAPGPSTWIDPDAQGQYFTSTPYTYVADAARAVYIETSVVAGTARFVVDGIKNGTHLGLSTYQGYYSSNAGNVEVNMCLLPGPATLTVTKVVLGSSDPVSSFPLRVTNQSTLVETNITSGVPVQLPAGNYDVYEIVDASDYNPVITGNCTVPNPNLPWKSVITLAADGNYNCTITNTKKAILMVVKNLITHGRDYDDDLVYFQAYNDAAQTHPMAWGTPLKVNPGYFQISETINAAINPFYKPEIVGGDCAANGDINLTAGQIAICTITNEEEPSYLIVSKTINNTGGGNAVVRNFRPYKVDSTTITLDPLSGTTGSSIATQFDSGLRVVSEFANADYDSVFGGDCDPVHRDVTLVAGQTKTCTITNTYNPDPTYTKCVNSQCVSLTGSGTSDCFGGIGSACTGGAGTHTECSNLTCGVVSLPGTNACTSNATCNNPNNTYFTCARLTCVLASGPGIIGCTSSNPDCNTSNNAHTVCAGTSCLSLPGTDTLNQCKSPAECNAQTHSVCTSSGTANGCVVVSGTGTNQCSALPGECNVTGRYAKCVNQKCVVTPGGTANCTSDIDCGGLGTGKHTICSGQTCVAISDTAGGNNQNQCSEPNDCLGATDTHTKCAGNSPYSTCVSVDGAGTNGCYDPSECTGDYNEKAICQNLKCVISTSSPYINECKSVSDCNGNLPPSATNLNVAPTICTGLPGQGLSYFYWNYTDLNGDVEGDYLFQIATFGNNFSPASLKVDRFIANTSTPSGGVNQQAVSLFQTTQSDSLMYNTLYEWRVKVCDVFDLCSDWIGGGTYYKSGHPDPVPSFTFSPGNPSAGSSVAFSDTSSCYNNSGLTACSSWIWNFGDNTTSTQQNPLHSYALIGNYNANLSATDNAGTQCTSANQIVPVGSGAGNSPSNPMFKEVSPLSP